MAKNCYAVSVVLAEMMGGIARPVYGQYHGSSVNSAHLYHRHGWVQVRNTVYDPTRFQFTGGRPRIWIGEPDSDDWLYDEGGWDFQGYYANLTPSREKDVKRTKMKWNKATAEAVGRIVFGDDRNCTLLTPIEMWHLTHVPPPRLGILLVPVYDALKETGKLGLVGEDMQRYCEFVREHGWEAVCEEEEEF